MTINLDEIHISTDCEEALAIAHDIDALINEQSEWDYDDCDELAWRK